MHTKYKIKVFIIVSSCMIFSVSSLYTVLRIFDPHHQTRRETIRQLEWQIENHESWRVSRRSRVYSQRILINNLDEKEMILDAIKNARPRRFVYGRAFGFNIIIGEVHLSYIVYGGGRNLIGIRDNNNRVHRYYTIPTQDHIRLRELVTLYVGDEIYRNPFYQR